MNDRESCGLCGSSLRDVETIDDNKDLLPLPNRPVPRISAGERKNIEAGLITLAVGAGLTVGGILMATNNAAEYVYRRLGVQLTIFGLITFMAPILGTWGGLFSGWRGWYAQAIGRRWTPDEPKEYPVNPDEKEND